MNVLAGYFQDVSDIDVARINVSKNDIQGFEFQQFPTFMMFPAGDENRSNKRMEKPADIGVGWHLSWRGENFYNV